MGIVPAAAEGKEGEDREEGETPFSEGREGKRKRAASIALWRLLGWLSLPHRPTHRARLRREEEETEEEEKEASRLERRRGGRKKKGFALFLIFQHNSGRAEAAAA